MSESDSERVVVKITPQVLEHKSKDLVVARIKELGLTGYGTTGEEATRSVRGLFKTFVEHHRRQGTLEEILNKSGLVWFWERDYPPSEKPYEDAVPSKQSKQLTSHVRPSTGDQWFDLNSEGLPLAA